MIDKLRLSDEGREFIKKHEGVVYKVYRDPIGLLTAGVGHLIDPNDADKDGYEWSEGDGVSEKDVDLWLTNDVMKAEEAVNEVVVTQLSQKGFDSLVSFVFNVGVDAFKRSTLLRMLNDGLVEDAADQFLRWKRAGGRVLPGLVKRRAEERELFLQGEVKEFLA